MSTLTKPLPRPVEALAGVDGCRGAWVVATEHDVAVVTALHRGLASIIGVDMPIGLPLDAARTSDRELRAFLGPRRSSVFTTPPRACLQCTDHPAAVAASRAAIGVGLSIQAFHLLPKIREVDALVAPGETQFHEVHPEAAFLVMNELEPLPPKRLPQGATRRAALLQAWFGPLPTVPRGARSDDVFDALAVLWSIHRYSRGEHLVFGDDGLDERGLPMRVIC